MPQELDAFLYAVVLMLVLVVVFQQITINGLRDRIKFMESQIREIHKLLIHHMPNEE